MPRLVGHIYRCKAIGEVGAQQMQVDVGTLKQTLLDMPTLGQATPTGYYGKLVASALANAEQAGPRPIDRAADSATDGIDRIGHHPAGHPAAVRVVVVILRRMWRRLLAYLGSSKCVSFDLVLPA